MQLRPFHLETQNFQIFIYCGAVIMDVNPLATVCVHHAI